MANEAEYEYHKRKYEEESSPPRARRPTGFSDGPPPPPPPLEDDFQLAKQKIQELASLANAKRSKFDNSDQKSSASNIQVGSTAYSYSNSKKIQVPNGRVGVIIGKSGDTIKNLQIQSGARIQVTRDADHNPNMPNRTVELMGNPDQIAKAEELINQVLSEADSSATGSLSTRLLGTTGFEPYVLKVPNNKVGLVIGKGGETIKNIQSRSGAKVQVIPLHLPPGDAPMERSVQIDGTSEQVEIAKQMVNEVIENRLRNPAMSGAYPQQSYQARPPMSWAPQPPQMQQQAGSYGFNMQQSGGYSGASYQYNQQSYPGYPQQNWDPSTAPQSQQPSQATGYDYYGQQQPPTQQQQASNGSQSGNTGYNYNQAPTSGGYTQQGYSQEGYGYQGHVHQHTNPQSEYNQHQGFGSAPCYGNLTIPPSQDGQAPYGPQGEVGKTLLSGQQPQQGYLAGPPSSNPGYPTRTTTEPGYGVPPTSQSSYGASSVPQSGYAPSYGQPQGQKTLPDLSAAYGLPQQSPSQVGGYAPTAAAAQPVYQPAQSSAQPAVTVAASTCGNVATQPGAYLPLYGAPPSYGQQSYHDGAYSQPTVENVVSATAPAPQPAAQPNGAAKASPKS